MMKSNNTSFNDLEAACIIKDIKVKEINVKEDTDLVRKPCLSDILCTTICISTIFTALSSPFIICDLYYALTDVSCVKQQCDGFIINMYTYLIASSIIGVLMISVMNCSIIYVVADNSVQDMNDTLKVTKDDDDNSLICFNIFVWILKISQLGWLITGCILFWGRMDITKCSNSIHDYLFARFILLIVCNIGNTMSRNK